MAASKLPTDAAALPPPTDPTLSTFRSAASARRTDAATHAVLGNEAADLDSVACAIVWAHVQTQLDPSLHALPFANVRRSELALRRDVLLALSLSGLTPDHLSYRDSSATPLEQCAALTLVDHNALPATDAALAPRVRAVLDHHVDERLFPDACPRVVDTVGSCATLVAERAVAADALLCPAAARLLLGAVLLDCHDMDAAVGKATPRDIAIAALLCERAGLDDMQRRALFQRLKRARKDIDGFSAYDLMRKDAKVVRGVAFNVAICSIGVSPVELVERAASEHGLVAGERRFAREWGVEHAVLMTGFGAGDAGFVRKIVVPRGQGADETRRLESFVRELLSDGEAIGLELDDAQIDGFVTLNQRDVKASRKQVLPIIRSLMQR